MSTKNRLSINLEDIFSDRRKLSHIHVKPYWKYVKDVKKHIKDLFKIQKFHLTSEDGFYLPLKESIEVIIPGEILKVYKKERNKANYDSSKIEDNEHHVSSFQKTENQNKSSKVTNFNNELENNSTENDAQNSVNFKIYKKLFNENISHAEHAININTTASKSRKRKRKHKSKVKNDNNSSLQNKNQNEIISRTPTNIPLNTSKTHIKFNDDGEEIEQSNNKSSNTLQNEEIENDEIEDRNKNKVMFKCDLYDVQQPRRIKPIPLGRKNVNNLISLSTVVVLDSDNENIKIAEKEFSVDCNEFDFELMDIEDQTLMVINAEEGNKENILSCNEIPNKQNKMIEQYSSSLKPLTTLPNVNDTIMFKIYRLNKDGENILSQSICGKVEEANNNTNYIKILILEGKDQLEHIEYKEEVTKNNEKYSYVYLKLDELIEAHVQASEDI